VLGRQGRQADQGVPAAWRVRWRKNGTPSFIRSRPPSGKSVPLPSDKKPRQRAIDALGRNGQVFRLASPERELAHVATVEDDLGNHHVVFRREIDGIPVWGEGAVVHLDGSGWMYAFNGLYHATVEPAPAAPTVGSEDAVERAEVHLLTQGTYAQPLGPREQLLLGYTGPTTQLCYWATDESGTLVLAWHVEIRPNFRDDYHYFIDATSGEVLDWHNASASEGPVTATGLDLHGDVRTLNVWDADDAYVMLDGSRPSFASSQPDPLWSPVGGLLTVSARGQDLDKGISQIWSENNVWTDPSAVSAHSNMGQVFEYFLDTHGRLGIDGEGGRMISVVHVTADGRPMDNAYWNGIVIAYGDGDESFSPLAGALDIAAHEFTHGMIQHTVNLEYRGQSGALNESFADVFAAMVDREDWLIGEDAVLDGVYPSGALRDMSSPHNNGVTSDHYWQPEHMDEYLDLPDSIDNGGVHINSGIPNRACYLLAQAIGRPKTEQIYYRVLDARYLNSRSNFDDMRLAAEQSARDLFGDRSDELLAVASAFEAVGVTGGTVYKPPAPVAPNEGEELLVFVNAAEDDSSLYVVRSVWDSDDDIRQLTPTQVLRTSARPVAVSSDGSYLLFVDSESNLRVINADGTGEEVIDDYGDWWSISLSPDGRQLASTSNTEDGAIWILDLVNADGFEEIALYEPTTQSDVSTQAVLFADALDWDTEGEYLIYDALNAIPQAAGDALTYWTVNLVQPESKSILPLFPPFPAGYHLGNPSFGNTTSRYVAFDFYSEESGSNEIWVYDLVSGGGGLIAYTSNFSNPAFSPDDTELAYTYQADDGSHNIARISLDLEHLSANGDPWGFVGEASSATWMHVPTSSTVSAPIASFDLSTTTGDVPLVVSFTDRSTGGIEQHAWDFGDGTTSGSPNPTHTYRSPGTYTVTLTVTNSGGSSTKSATITASAPPVALDTRLRSNGRFPWEDGLGANVYEFDTWRLLTWADDSSGGGTVTGEYIGEWSNEGLVPVVVSYHVRFFGESQQEIGRYVDEASTFTLQPGETRQITTRFSVPLASVEEANSIASMAVFAGFTEGVSTARLLVRAIISGREYVSSTEVSVNRRVNFQVLRYTRPNLSDTTEVFGFTMTIPPSLGSATGATGFRVGTVAGVVETVTIEYEGLRGEFAFTTVPAKVIDHIVIEPSEVTLAPGERVDFRAIAVDRYGNSYPAKGTVLWAVLPSEMGSVVERSGRFTAGDWSGEGYVVAFAVHGLEFGNTETSVQGSGKVTISTPLPTEFALHQNHPNPFNPGTQIRFDTPRESMVRLDIYNMAGQWITRLVEEALDAGQHTVMWSPAGLPSGVYIYRLHADEYVEIQKMLLVR
jgi:bacillolysin